MPPTVYSPSQKNLRFLAAQIAQGELVAIPTETVYGLAANALDAVACKKIFRAKQRPANDPLIVHVLGLRQAEKLAVFHPLARRMARKFWPGPLTLVLAKKGCVPGVVTSGGSTVAVRAPAHPVARKLLQESGLPLAAPSANSFGYISPTEPTHVVENLGNRIKHIIDGGACSIGVESTILDLSDPSAPRILRTGSVTAAEIEKVLKPVRLSRMIEPANDRIRQLAPGMLSKHYSPRTPMSFRGSPVEATPETGVILLRRPSASPSAHVYWLSESGSVKDIARNLYRILRQADKAGHRRLVIEQIPLPASGLAAAICDRLTRAVAAK
jgi:L-threonylcarbamoyladenylate synthase